MMRKSQARLLAGVLRPPAQGRPAPGLLTPLHRPAPQQAAAACGQEPCRQRSGIARPEDEGLTAAALLLLHGWRALSAAAAKAAPAVPWTSLSSIKVHRIQAPVGCSRRGKEGVEPPYLGRVQAPGAVCAMPHCASQKNPPWEPGASTRPAPYPGSGSSKGKLIFYGISGAARRAAAPFQPGWARPRGKPGGDGEAGAGQRRHVLPLVAFHHRSNSPALVRAGPRPAAPCPGGCKGGGEACRKGGEEKWRGLSPQECSSVLLEAVSALTPCTNHAFLPPGMGQSPPAQQEELPASSPNYFGSLAGGGANIKTKKSLPRPSSQTKGSTLHFPRYSDGAEMTLQADRESCCHLQGCSGWPRAGSAAWFEFRPHRFRTDRHRNSSSAYNQGHRREPKQVPMFGWASPRQAGWGSYPDPVTSSQPLWLAGGTMRAPYQLQQQTKMSSHQEAGACIRSVLQRRKPNFYRRGAHARSHRHTHTHTHTEPR